MYEAQEGKRNTGVLGGECVEIEEKARIGLEAQCDALEGG